MKTTNDISVLDRFQKKALLEVIKTSILAEVTAKFQEIYNGAIEPMVNLRKATRQMENMTAEELIGLAGV
ncbi:MAG TPA: hypothetical protein EYN67_12665 [Flavobacteriales bacterium]|nr:hypothetical protein [Methylococcaceae bacterium]HHZ96375.1 hypothetical protein [Flavobacteriales bacterium]